MINDVNKKAIVHFGDEMLHIIDSEGTDGEALMYGLVERYKSHPGFMFLCRIFSQPIIGDDYCWWMLTNNVAIYYRRKGDTPTLLCWASPQEVQNLKDLVVFGWPF